MKQSLILLLILIIGLNADKVVYKASEVPLSMSVDVKKDRFYALLVPAVEKIHKELLFKYKIIAMDIKQSKNLFNIDLLKQKYRVHSDEELLMALKPHPQSIVLAQAAMESAWGTSRFFTKANNVFGMWSANKNEPRIAASQKRGGKRTIWLRKFSTIEESIRAYYFLMARGKAFKEFRSLRVQTENPYELVKKLDKYSEIGDKYGEELTQMIKYNKLTKYDDNSPS